MVLSNTCSKPCMCTRLHDHMTTAVSAQSKHSSFGGNTQCSGTSNLKHVQESEALDQLK